MSRVELAGWRSRIDAAERRGGFSDLDYYVAANPATCMVGERGRLEGDLDGAPVGMTAAAEKTFFGLPDAVAANDFAAARRYLETVEEGPVFEPEAIPA